MFGSPRKLFAPPKPEEKKPDTAPPASLTREDLAAALAPLAGLKNELEGKISELRGAMAEMSSRQPQVIVQGNPNPPAPERHEPPPLTDAQISEAIQSGDVNAIRGLVQKAVGEAAGALGAELRQLREFGVTTLASIGTEVAKGRMPKYSKFQKEIDEGISRLAPELRANPEALQMIHDAVVGRHADEIEKAAREEAIRQMQEDQGGEQGGQGEVKPKAAGGMAPGTGAGPAGQREAKKRPSLAEYAGEEGLTALKHKDRGAGKDENAYAQSLGYGSWDHMMEEFEKAQAEGEKLGIAATT